MFDKIDRNYKECSAADTINKITGILEGLDLMPQETYYSNFQRLRDNDIPGVVSSPFVSRERYAPAE